MKGIVPTQDGKMDEAKTSWYSQCRARWRTQPEKGKQEAVKQTCSLPPVSARGPALVDQLELSRPRPQPLTARAPVGLPRSVFIARQRLPEDQRPSTAEIQEIATRLRVPMAEALAFCLPADEEGPKAEERKEKRAARAEKRRLEKAAQDLVEYRSKKKEKAEEEEKAKEEERKQQEEQEANKESKRLHRQKFLRKRMEVLIHAKDEEERTKAELELKEQKEQEKKEALMKKYRQKQQEKLQQWHLQKNAADQPAEEDAVDAAPDAGDTTSCIAARAY